MNRRNFIKHLGIGVALPFLPSLLPKALWADEKQIGANKRILFLYVPNGKIMNKWTPKTFGSNFDLTQTLNPLSKVKDNIQILTGLAHLKAFANGDGAGDHARAGATYLTGCQALKTAGPNIKNGISIDQVIANKVGQLTVLPSIELSCDANRLSGNCDSGYSCAYQFNLSWKTESTPMPAEANPKLAYRRLFYDPFGENNPKGFDIKRSLLEETNRETKALLNKLGQTDKNKINEYLDSLDSVEQRIKKIEKMQTNRVGEAPALEMPENYSDHLKIMMDIICIAFKADATRVITFLLAHEGSDRSFPAIGVNDAHHPLSHHKDNPSNIRSLEKIDLFYIEHLAYILEKMQNTKEENGTLLDNTMVLYGCGISDGNSHSHRDLPIILAGGKNVGLKSGRHLEFKKDTPMTNLFLTLAEKMDVKLDKFGDSYGKIDNI